MSWDQVFGSEIPLAARFVIALIIVVALTSLTIFVAKKILRYFFPALRMKTFPLTGRRDYDTPAFGRYSSLRGFAFMLRFTGALAIIGAILCVCIVVVLKSQPPTFAAADFVVTYIFMSAAAFLFMSGLCFMALGEAMKVIVDIALNTEPLTNIADDTHWFRERLGGTGSTETNRVGVAAR